MIAFAEKELIVSTATPEEENTILSTFDYEKFTLDPTNRPIDPKHLAGLVESIREDNLLHLFPIVVNRKGVVTDGQHRLRAAEILKVEISYIISDRMLPHHARKLSGSTKEWKMHDYLHHWYETGLEDYAIVREFWHANRWLGLTTAAQLATNTMQGARHFKTYWDDGSYKANNIAFARSLASMLLDFKPWISFYNDRRFITVMKILAKDHRYDHERMLQKMQTQHSRLVKQATADGYWPIITDIYNFKCQDANRVHFDKDMRRKSR